jgi:hypothetical protein
MTENRVLRRMFGPNDEVKGGWRKLHNEELRNLYSSPGVIRIQVKEDELGRACNTNYEKKKKRNRYKILVGNPEGYRPLGRPRRRWMDIKMDRGERGRDGMDWIDLAQDRELL